MIKKNKEKIMGIIKKNNKENKLYINGVKNARGFSKKYPFSKENVRYSRFEAYVMSIAFLILLWFEKDVGSIVILLSLSWGGYKGLQGMYIWMAKNEHEYELKYKYKEKGLSESDIEEIESDSDNIEDEEFDPYA